MIDSVVRYLAQPYVLLLLLLGIGLALAWRRSERGIPLLLATFGWLGLALWSLPMTAWLAIGSLEWQNPPLATRPTEAEAIVVLGGGVHVPDEVRLALEPSGPSLWRAIEAARLYGEGAPCPVIVVGGSSADAPPGATEASAIRDALVRLGVGEADIVTDDRSVDTFDNAVIAAELLRERGLGPALVVTQGWHLPRAVACFEKQGVEVLPAGCEYRATEIPEFPKGCLPNAGALESSERAFHEWLGITVYWARGRL